MRENYLSLDLLLYPQSVQLRNGADGIWFHDVSLTKIPQNPPTMGDGRGFLQVTHLKIDLSIAAMCSIMK